MWCSGSKEAAIASRTISPPRTPTSQSWARAIRNVRGVTEAALPEAGSGIEGAETGAGLCAAGSIILSRLQHKETRP